VVDCTALEMRHTGNRIGGSNPSLSASRFARWANLPDPQRGEFLGTLEGARRNGGQRGRHGEIRDHGRAANSACRSAEQVNLMPHPEPAQPGPPYSCGEKWLRPNN
jgi:hypothetical protein